MLAVGFVVLCAVGGARRAGAVTDLPAWSTEAPAADPSSATGFAGGRRMLVVPEHDNAGAEWIARAQRLLGEGEWRSRVIATENAPLGRADHAPAVYRWWLGLVAWGVALVGNGETARSVETAALIADPLLLGLAVLGLGFLVRVRFGSMAGAAVSLGLAASYPLAAGFVAGLPASEGLANLALLGAQITLISAVAAGIQDETGRASQRWSVAAGVLFAFALWLRAPVGVPLLVATLVGVAGAAWSGLQAKANGAAPWRVWTLSGAAAVLVFWLMENFPDRLADWRLQAIHPVFALGWMGGGELVCGLIAWRNRGPVGSWRLVLRLLAALMLLLAPFAAMWAAGSAGSMFERDLSAMRLTGQPDGVVAANLWEWLGRKSSLGGLLACLATLLPAVLSVFWLPRSQPAGRQALLIALVPLAAAVGFATVQMAWWQVVGALALAVVPAVVLAGECDPCLPGRRWWPALAAVPVLLGLLQVAPRTVPRGGKVDLTEAETRSLVERDLAWWLAQRSAPEPAVIAAPPDLTAGLIHFGGHRGVGTLAAENEPGLAALVRIASATSPDEALALINNRGITHLVVPSWDTTLDRMTGSSAGPREGTFMAALRDWQPPSWIRPVAYHLAENELFQGMSVTVWEIVPEQSDAAALSHLADYFAETGQAELASASAAELRKFPADLGALVARANVALALGDKAAFGQMVDTIAPLLARKADRFLPWERRVGLAAVLTQARRTELAAEQLKRCLAEVDERKIRQLSPGSLVRLLVVCKLGNQEIADLRLRALARSLVPPALRARL